MQAAQRELGPRLLQKVSYLLLVCFMWACDLHRYKTTENRYVVLQTYYNFFSDAVTSEVWLWPMRWDMLQKWLRQSTCGAVTIEVWLTSGVWHVTEVVEPTNKVAPEPRSGRSSDQSSKLKYIFRGAQFFLIKSNNHENVALAKAKGVWSTPPYNESRINQSYKVSCYSLDHPVWLTK